MLLAICFTSFAAQETPTGDDLKEGRKAIEQFLSVTATWIIELEWTYGYGNKTPSALERSKAMLAGDLSRCPADFREAWMMQTKNPRLNYVAPLLRKYKVDLPALRESLSRQLRHIDSGISPPIPLYGDDEVPPRVDPSRCGSQRAIISAVEQLRAKLNGIDPAKAKAWQVAVSKVMLEFSLNYMETVICMNVAGIPRREVEAMFGGIDVSACPPDFAAAWNQSLPSFKKADFSASLLRLAAMCKKYGVDEGSLLEYVKRKMQEWELAMPAQDAQDDFRKKYKLLKSNIMDHR